MRFANRTKSNTALIETALTGEPLYYYSSPPQLRCPQLRYFGSYAIFNWVQKTWVYYYNIRWPTVCNSLFFTNFRCETSCLDGRRSTLDVLRFILWCIGQRCGRNLYRKNGRWNRGMYLCWLLHFILFQISKSDTEFEFQHT